MIKKLKRLMCLIICIVLLSVPSYVLAADTQCDNDESKVIIYVYANAYDDDYIKKIAFEDGTVVGDYEYEIIYEYEDKITRDPMFVPYYFDFTGWIDRDGVISLSLDPNDNVRSDSSLKDIAWSILKTPEYGVASNRYWPTEESKINTFKWQYDCHFTFANDKDYWNLEPHREAQNYLSVVLGSCNP